MSDAHWPLATLNKRKTHRAKISGANPGNESKEGKAVAGVRKLRWEELLICFARGK
jgi:hypothetical protein